MTTCRHCRSLAVLLAASALLGVGCSGGDDADAGSDTTDAITTEGVAADEMTLDGVRFDVRRDPG
jgi:hypothetical protein